MPTLKRDMLRFFPHPSYLSILHAFLELHLECSVLNKRKKIKGEQKRGHRRGPA